MRGSFLGMVLEKDRVSSRDKGEVGVNGKIE